MSPGQRRGLLTRKSQQEGYEQSVHGPRGGTMCQGCCIGAVEDSHIASCLWGVFLAGRGRTHAEVDAPVVLLAADAQAVVARGQAAIKSKGASQRDSSTYGVKTISQPATPDGGRWAGLSSGEHRGGARQSAACASRVKPASTFCDRERGCQSVKLKSRAGSVSPVSQQSQASHSAEHGCTPVSGTRLRKVDAGLK